ncbi:hypothetical protein HYV64_05505 [Candidatus Shapirobacteria bacterium]|nr:hypothetical protein [Candidatus Shapirobacteria bacterium]
MKTFDPNRRESYSREELITLHQQAEAASRSSLTSLDLSSAHSHISTMEQIRARFIQDFHTAFPKTLCTTLRSV